MSINSFGEERTHTLSGEIYSGFFLSIFFERQSRKWKEMDYEYFS